MRNCDSDDMKEDYRQWVRSEAVDFTQAEKVSDAVSCQKKKAFTLLSLIRGGGGDIFPSSSFFLLISFSYY